MPKAAEEEERPLRESDDRGSFLLLLLLFLFLFPVGNRAFFEREGITLRPSDLQWARARGNRFESLLLQLPPPPPIVVFREKGKKAADECKNV